MADNETNKFDAKTGWGDPSATLAASRNDEKNDFSRDGAGMPNGIFAGDYSGYPSNNKYDVSTSFGDTEPLNHWENDNAGDYAHDVSGIVNPNSEMQTDMDMALAPNKFPHETGHDSLGGEDAIFLV